MRDSQGTIVGSGNPALDLKKTEEMKELADLRLK